MRYVFTENAISEERKKMKNTMSMCLAAAMAVFAGCATTDPAPAAPPPPPPSATLVHVGAGNDNPVSEVICAYVADSAMKNGKTVVTRDRNAPYVSAFVSFGFQSVEKAKLDDWYVCTGILSMKASVLQPAVGEVVLAEETVKIDGPRRLGKKNAVNALVRPMQNAADRWYKANVTPARIRKASK